MQVVRQDHAGIAQYVRARTGREIPNFLFDGAGPIGIAAAYLTWRKVCRLSYAPQRSDEAGTGCYAGGGIAHSSRAVDDPDHGMFAAQVTVFKHQLANKTSRAGSDYQVVGSFLVAISSSEPALDGRQPCRMA